MYRKRQAATPAEFHLYVIDAEWINSREKQEKQCQLLGGKIDRAARGQFPQCIHAQGQFASINSWPIPFLSLCPQSQLPLEKGIGACTGSCCTGWKGQKRCDWGALKRSIDNCQSVLP